MMLPLWIRGWACLGVRAFEQEGWVGSDEGDRPILFEQISSHPILKLCRLRLASGVKMPQPC